MLWSRSRTQTPPHYYIKADKDPLLELALANEDEPGRWPCFFDLAKDLVGKSGTIETVLSHLTASQLSIARARAGELGGFGVEHLPRRVWEEINLRAKLYSTRFNNDADEQKSKGIVKRARPKHEAYRETMATGLEQAASFFGAAEPAVHPGGGPAQQEGAEPAERQGLPGVRP